MLLSESTEDNIHNMSGHDKPHFHIHNPTTASPTHIIDEGGGGEGEEWITIHVVGWMQKPYLIPKDLR